LAFSKQEFSDRSFFRGEKIMSDAGMGRPAVTEHAPYYSKYIDLVADGDIVAVLQTQLDETLSLLQGLSEEKAVYKYAPDKWSIKEVLGHIIDTERIMAYRALRFARNDKTPVEGFEQDDYAANAPFDKCQLKDLLAEFTHVRQANIYMFKSLPADAGLRTGSANKNEISVRALAYVIAGHELHHVGIIRTKYL
jgi:hypothetical protein